MAMPESCVSLVELPLLLVLELERRRPDVLLDVLPLPELLLSDSDSFSLPKGRNVNAAGAIDLPNWARADDLPSSWSWLINTPNWQISIVVIAIVEPAAASEAPAELTLPTAVLAIAAIPVTATVTPATLFDVAATTEPVVVVLSFVIIPSASSCARCCFFAASLSLPELELSTSMAEHVHDENEDSDEYVHCSESDMVEFDRNVETDDERDSRAEMTSLVKNDSRSTPSYTDDEIPLSPPYTQALFVHAGNEQMEMHVDPEVVPTEPL